jgi:hypothetical protein
MTIALVPESPMTPKSDPAAMEYINTVETAEFPYV